ncbi:hypothetical protein OOK27_22970 [Streptomyces canus]|uniref:hypothetical protein n=1 Tax=Streptomyces canus TaxID=58343 RepID=UPI00224C9CA8|nr:hypothetical protein [Streptomyces canus]MCX5256950.1 hypothetical protein [Streptomyces canus]
MRRGQPIARIVLLHADSLQAKGLYETEPEAENASGTEITGRIAVRVSKGHAHVEGYQVADGDDPDHLQSAQQTLCERGGAREVPLFSAATPSAGAVS